MCQAAACEASSCEALAAAAPRYVFGFSTGHVGTTSLSSRRLYHCECEVRAHCRCALSHHGFFHESGQRRGLQSSHPTLREWHEAPLRGGTPAEREAELVEREAELVRRAYLPMWGRHERALVLSHDTLYLQRGILAAVPHKQLLMVRIRRAREEFIASFGRYDRIERDWYPLVPSAHGSISHVAPAAWDAMSMADKAAWFADEVEAQWQQLRREHPELPVLEVEWSKARDGSFYEMADAIASAAGLRLAQDCRSVHRRPGSARQHAAC